MDPRQQPAPGWYPDPQGGGAPAERWWDGTAWSAATRALAAGPAAGGWGAPAPGYGHGDAQRPATALDLATGTTSDERTWAITAHLSAVIGAFLGPLVVYLVKRDESPFVRAHAAAALNFHLSWTLWTLALGVAAVVLTIVTLGLGLFVVMPLFLAVGVASVVFVVLATVKAGRGEAPTPAMYPLSITFVR